MGRRQQVVDRAICPKLPSPGYPEFQWPVEVAFWRAIAEGVLPGRSRRGSRVVTSLIARDRAWVLGWSPEQISNRLKIAFPADESMRISHEAIYQSLFIESRGAFVRENSSGACALAGRFGSLVKGPGERLGLMSPRGR